ncbi:MULTISPECIES: glycosyltransferase [unclassified Flavobacterium]|uniref:glycosyltransferase n=1 Tax=unclassified Flavobacterium TaxID=196869 RepID=UPI00129106FF|nr:MULTISPECIES: glycosyltransferase [unclassified Flavobacterium]MQP52063.1 glycosyltransferase [Flavobacterium sp. LMO9]MQP61932.1 glycosyltransferase [Flavobacterium sp. LMO6]
MNIALVLSQNFDPDAGGVQRTTSKLAKIYQSKNQYVVIISVGNHLTQKEYYDGIALYYINFKEVNQLKNVLHDEKITCIINQVGYSVSLTKLILKNKPLQSKLINTLRINPLNFYDNHQNLIEELFNRKKITFLNTLLTRKIILGYHIIKQKLELRFIVKNTDAFVLLSEKFKPELFFLVPSLKKYNHKIHGIGNPFQRPDIDLNTIQKENIVLFVGRLNIPQKRVDLLLQIWKKLHEEFPDWRFWILGEGEEKKKMEQFCKDNQLDRITFFGKVNPNEYYKKAKLFHMTSAFEGFGNVLIEAQSYGCLPMLFDSYAAASDIVWHNRNGVVIQPFDVEDYVVQTKNLMNNPDKISELAIHAYENVLRFSYEETYLKWKKVFNSLK